MSKPTAEAMEFAEDMRERGVVHSCVDLEDLALDLDCFAREHAEEWRSAAKDVLADSPGAAVDGREALRLLLDRALPLPCEAPAAPAPPDGAPCDWIPALGAGSAAPAREVPLCPTCNGNGYVFTFTTVCPTCGGTGTVPAGGG